MIAGLVKVYRLYTVWKYPGHIVKDRLVGKYIRGHLQGGLFTRYYEACHLRFASYSKYKIPGENYSWSDLHCMNDKTVYSYAECGDEFYLVLSKPHTGKILLAYNAKMFDYQSPKL